MKKTSEQNKIDNSLKFLFKSSLFISLGVILSKIIAYVYRIIIARYFGPETYGLFSLAIIFVSWLIAIFSLGLFEGILRFIPLYRGENNTHKIRYLLKICITILFFTGILSGISLYIFSGYISVNLFNNPNLTIFLKICSFIIPFSMFLSVYSSVILAFEKVKVHTFIMDFSENIFKLFSLILLIFVGLKTNSVMLSYFLGIVLAFFISYFYCKYKISEIFGKINLELDSKKEIRKELFSYSWPLIFSGIVSAIFPYIDILVLGFFKKAAEVGLYNAAVPLAILTTLPPMLFIRIFFPLITKEFARKNFEVIKELSKQIEKWILIINLPVSLLMIIFPGAFINILFGSEYLVAANSLRLLTIGFFFYSMSVIFYSLLSMAGKSKVLLINISVISTLNLILDIILVSKYGMNGVAFATMLCNIILSIIMFYQVKQYTSIIPIRRKMLGILFSIIIPTILLLYVKQFIKTNIFTIIIQGLFFMLLYLFLIFITKSFDKNDLMIINTIKNKIKNK
jgi:O-antigen/teichoic acid export membrane protein